MHSIFFVIQVTVTIWQTKNLKLPSASMLIQNLNVSPLINQQCSVFDDNNREQLWKVENFLLGIFFLLFVVLYPFRHQHIQFYHRFLTLDVTPLLKTEFRSDVPRLTYIKFVKTRHGSTYSISNCKTFI